MDLVFLLGAPVSFAFAFAFVFGRIMKRNLTKIPMIIRGILAIVSPICVVIAYFWIWQVIDHSIHEANGGGAYMGPIVVLIYAWQIFALAFLLSGFLAAYRFAKS